MATTTKPVVLVCADRQIVGDHPFHMAGEKYIKAVVEAADALPIILPALPHNDDISDLLEQVDGVLLTGAYANIQPQHYNAPPAPTDELQDPARDASTLPLIPRLIEMAVPLMGVCRGFQEVNVAFGGSLLHRVDENRAYFNHCKHSNAPLDVQYSVIHSVLVTPNSRLRHITGVDRFMVNSLHGQGIDRLGEGLVIEARAEDGLIEAVSVRDAEAFTMAVQWHPEWKTSENKEYSALFSAFGDACRQRLLWRQ